MGALSLSEGPYILALPALRQGFVLLSFPQKTPTQLEIHNKSIRFLALNYEGTLLASATETGLRIRITNTETGN